MHCMDVLCYENLLFFVIRGGHSFETALLALLKMLPKKNFVCDVTCFILCNKRLEKIYLKILRILCLMLYGSFLFINFWCFTCIYILTHYDTSHHVTKCTSEFTVYLMCSLYMCIIYLFTDVSLYFW